MAEKRVSAEVDTKGVVLITIDNPPMNVLHPDGEGDQRAIRLSFCRVAMKTSEHAIRFVVEPKQNGSGAGAVPDSPKLRCRQR